MNKRHRRYIGHVLEVSVSVAKKSNLKFAQIDDWRKAIWDGVPGAGSVRELLLHDACYLAVNEPSGIQFLQRFVSHVTHTSTMDPEFEHKWVSEFYERLPRKSYDAASSLEQALSRFRSVQDIVAILGFDELSPSDQEIYTEAEFLASCIKSDYPPINQGTVIPESPTVDSFIKQLDEIHFARPGESLVPYAKPLLQQLVNSLNAPQKAEIQAIPPLPSNASELWKDRKDRSESAVQFATRVYRVWMDAGVLSRPDVKRLDPDLYGSINSWLIYNRRKANPEPLPEGFNLLTAKQATDAWIARVTSGKEGLPSDPAALARFAMAQKYRESGKSNKR